MEKQEIIEDRLDQLEEEEEKVLDSGGNLSGSMVGRRRVLITWAVGEAWERFSRERKQVIQRAFRAVGLSLPIDGSSDSEISVKGIETAVLIDGLKDWQKGGPVDDEHDRVGLSEKDDDVDIFYEDTVHS